MRRARILLALTLLCVPLAAARPETTPAPPNCAVPEGLTEDEFRLTELAQHLRDKHAITIVAIGGASTAGTAAAAPEQDAYPRRLQNLLRQRHPGIEITVINKGIARQTTQEMV